MASDPPLLETCREMCAAWGIESAEVLAAIRTPDQTEFFEDTESSTELRLRIVAKQTAPSPQSAWLIAGEKFYPPPHGIDFAIRAFAEEGREFDKLTPLQMLESVVRTCETPVSIGGIRAPFVLQQRALLPLSNQLVIPLGGDADKYVGVVYAHVADDSSSVVITLAFVIGLKRYNEYLRSHLQ